ncbi:MAG: hypothetical protein HC880_13270 [Bacteroidia bacterium]|nr:hypothetical protein [Bacteroidia bacterium]
MVSYSPETSLSFGAGGKYLYKLKNCDPRATRISQSTFSFRYTLNRQMLLKFENNLFFDENKYILNLRFNYNKFPVFFYGIGNNNAREQ